MTPPEIIPTDAVADSRIVERDRTHLTEAEQTLLKELLRPGADIDAAISRDLPADRLWHTLDACVRGIRILETRMLRIRPIIGRILQVFEAKPSLYKDLGFETFRDFMHQGVYDALGLHKTAAYQAKLVASQWPQLGPDRYANLGPKKLDVLSKFTNGRASNAEAWLQTAESMKVRELQQYVAQRGFIEPGEMDWAEVRFPTNKANKAIFDDFFADERVHSVCGSKQPDHIFLWMISECLKEWIIKAEQGERK